MDTHLLGNLPTDPDRNLLMLIMTALSRYVLTCLVWLINTLLLWYVLTSLSRNINTLLLRNLPADWVSHLPLLSLGYILTLIIRVLLACAGYWRPHLAIALTLPPVLTVLLVQGGALRLYEWFILCLVLIHTDTVVDSLTFILIDSPALCPDGVQTQSMVLCHTLLVILCGAHLCLCLLVLCVPHSGVLSCAQHRWLPEGDG